mmetsp:Transcript_24018/g.35453  ORF Transcript_24018/g.35453 Transcript_24018/m.35453 type:complete len:87 (+) Transcript_24018:458-718(+)
MAEAAMSSIAFGLGHSKSRRRPLQDSSTLQAADGPLVRGSGDEIDGTIFASEKIATAHDFILHNVNTESVNLARFLSKDLTTMVLP